MPRHAGPPPPRTVLRLVLVAVAMAGALAGILLMVTAAHDDGAAGAGAAASGPAAPTVPAVENDPATIVGVSDAVTLDVRLPGGREVVRVRALGVAAPGACYGEEATAFARRVLGGQAVDLTASDLRAADSPPVDRFDRRLQRVVLTGGRDYAVLAAEAGIARTYSVGAPAQTMPPVRAAEARARAAARGVWGPPCAGRDD